MTKKPLAQDSKILLTSVVDFAGVTRGKSIPSSRSRLVSRNGVGASVSWALFSVVNDIAWIPSIGVVGDDRLVPDLSNVYNVDDSMIWAPADVWNQDGQRAFWCTRNFLREQVNSMSAEGIEVRVGSEIEFTLLPNYQEPNLRATPRPNWSSYGISGLLDYQEFVHDVCVDFERLGLGLEQFHAEFGDHQFELSMAHTDPIRAMDKIVLAKILLGRIARRYNCRLSFSPRPFADGASNGAHMHMSFYENGSPLLSGPPGPHGIGERGGSIIGGIVRYLPEFISMLAPSVLSPARLQESWSGSYACWGTENREAAVRFCEGDGNSSNIEVKCIDPSANPYISCGAILIMAKEGIAQNMQLPQEVEVDPSSLSNIDREKCQVVRVGTDQMAMLNELENSELARRALCPGFLDCLLAVRKYEYQAFSKCSLDETIAALRFAWSI